jgi:hypothetical protein
MINDKQHRKFYFPHWHRAAKANNWVMSKGRLVSKRPEDFGASAVDQLQERVWETAEARALQHHRAVTADDLRHACHIVALGRDKSSQDFDNRDLDRVVALFRLLERHDDVGAMLDWNDPQRQQRERLVWSIEHAAPEAYVTTIARDKFKTTRWQDLDLQSLRQLAMTLRQRTKSWNKPAPAVADCPF